MNKILILSPDLDKKGGVSNYVSLLSKGLKKNNFEVKFLFSGKSKNNLKNYFYPILFFIQVVKLRNILDEYKPDIIHINPSLTLMAIIRDFLFLKMIKKNDYPVLFFIHGWRHNINSLFKNKLLKNLFKKNFEKADLIIVLASNFKDELINIGLNGKKISISSPMIETKCFILNKKDFLKPYIVLFCSNMSREKGIFEIIDAIPKILEKYPTSKFIFLGDGKDLNALKNKSKKQNLENNVTFTGYLKGKQKYDIFKKSHIFAFPSYSEGFPTVVIEAMASGLVPVYTPVGGLADALLDGVNGIRLNSIPAKPKDLAKKIIKLMEHPEEMKKISKSNINIVNKKFSTEIIVEKMINMYEKTISLYNQGKR